MITIMKALMVVYIVLTLLPYVLGHIAGAIITAIRMGWRDGRMFVE